MVDNIKIVQTDLSLKERILANPLLTFQTAVDMSTGALENYSTAEFKGLKLLVYDSGRVQIRGSLHKYWNNGLHNYNDFSAADIAIAIKRLEYELKFNANEMRIHNLEIGLNIKHSFNTNEILNNIVAYGKKPLNNVKTNTPGKVKQADLSQYSFKIYNKSIQSHLEFELIRIEKQVTKMECLTAMPVYLSTLTNAEFFDHMFNNLISSFDNLIFTEPVIVGKLSEQQQLLYSKCSNPREWENMTPKSRWQYKKDFNHLLIKYGSHHYRSVLRDLMFLKKKELTNYPAIRVTPSGYITPNKEYSDRLITISEHPSNTGENLHRRYESDLSQKANTINTSDNLRLPLIARLKSSLEAIFRYFQYQFIK